MLVVPWAVGCGMARALGARAVLVLVGSLALFLAQHRLIDWYRGRRAAPARAARHAPVGSLALLTAVGLAGVAPALGALPPAVVAMLAGAAGLATAASLWLVRARLDHALPGQVLAAVSLPLTAPVAYFASGGARPRVALALWVIAAAFFLWGVLYVNLEIRARARRRPLARPTERLSFAAPTLVADAALALVVVLALESGGLAARALAAFGPAALQSIAATARLDRPAPLKRVGLALLAHAIAFAVLVVLLA